MRCTDYARPFIAVLHEKSRTQSVEITGETRHVRIVSGILIPVAVLRNAAGGKLAVIEFPDFDFSVLDGLQDIRVDEGSMHALRQIEDGSKK